MECCVPGAAALLAPGHPGGRATPAPRGSHMDKVPTTWHGVGQVVLRALVQGQSPTSRYA